MLGGQALAVLASPTVEELVTRLVQAGQAIGLFVGILVVVYLPGRLLAVPALHRIEGRVPVSETTWYPFVRVVNAAFAVFALYFAIPLSGLATTPTTIAALSAGATIAIGFAAQDVLSNLVSGAFIVADPKFHIGDWIRWGDREGIVEDISFRVTRVHTFDNELITVPNSELTANTVVNPGAKETVRISQELGISYDDSVDHAEEVVVEVAHGIDGVLDRPSATVRVAELGESALVVTARFWVADPARADVLRIRSTFIRRIIDRFNEADIEMPYPTRELRGSIESRRPPAEWRDREE